MRLPRFIAVALALAAASFPGQALAVNPFVHQLFTSHMVLQRDAADPIWGWTTPGAGVSVTVNGVTYPATAGADGRWQVAVGPFSAGGPYTVSVTGPQTVTFTDVMFGDVWLCAGQSNMDGSLNSVGGSPVINVSAEIADSVNYPNIRHFKVPLTSSLTPNVVLTGAPAWQVPGSTTTGSFTATGYFSAREIYKQQGIPQGIVCSSWGGTTIQCWVSSTVAGGIADFTQTMFDQTASTPGMTTVSGLYNAMIAPLAPFRFKGVIWYQGEANTSFPEQYGRLLPGLMSNWRSLFAQPSLPFVIVQLPNINGVQTAPVETGSWAEQREAQARTVLADANSRLVTTIDIGGATPFNNNAAEIHPRNKQDVGLRVARAMANLVYGQNVVNQGPIFTGATVSGSNLTCTFSNAGAGLMVGTKDYQTPLSPAQPVTGGTLKGFAIAGSNHTFYAATATITGSNTVVVSSPSVATPLYVRYGWGGNPQCNLYNKITDAGGNVVDGLPAGSFRNDPVYRLNVNPGPVTSTTTTLGATLPVTAGSSAGETFHHWSGDTALLSSTTAASASATMSQYYVSVLANYQITSAPANVSAIPVDTAVALTWDALPGAHYTIMRSVDGGASYAQVATNVVNSTYVDTTVPSGSTYYYYVTAYNAVGASPASSTVHSMAGPATPVGPSANGEQSPSTAAKAFDGTTTTKWYNPTTAPGWLQYNYGPGSTRTMVGYDLTSGNDVPQRDPMSWKFQGSNDGRNWVTLDTRTGETFPSRLQTKHYSFTNTTAYQYYWLYITANAGGSGYGIQLTDLALTPATASASGEQAGAIAAFAFDNSVTTKWYTPTTAPGWLQYNYGTGGAQIVSRYDLTSGNDVPQRDPRDWTFQGSNDGNTWTTLDTRGGEIFASRNQTKTYTFTNTTPYQFYRLNVGANSGGSGYGIQLTEMALTVSSGLPGTIYAGDDAAEGANITTGGGQDSASGAVTYAFAKTGTTYVNTTTNDLQITLTEVNFFPGTVSGQLTPFACVYSGDQTTNAIKTASNYRVEVIGDPISTTASSGLQHRAFVSGGINPKVTLAPGQSLAVGYLASAGGIVRYDGTAVGTIDYVAVANTLPASVPNFLTVSANTALDRTLKFNVGFTSAPAPLTYIGDDAAEGNAPTNGTAQDSLGTPLVYDFVASPTTYQNTTASAQLIYLSEVNFYAGSAGGTLTPFVSVYSGNQTNTSVNAMGNYKVLAIGDPLTITASSGRQNRAFQIGGISPTITLQPGEVLTAGYLGTSGGIVRYATTPSGVIDYIPLTNTMPSSVPNSFTGNGTTTLDRTIKYNIGMRVRSGPFKVACVGDSITFGVGATSGTPNKYVTRLGTLLGSSYAVFNYGVSSRTMLKHGDFPYWEEDGLHSGKTSAFRDSQTLLPDIVIIMLGTNDSKNNPNPGGVNNWQYKSEFEPNYIEMINVYRSLSSHPMIYVNTCPTVSGPGAYSITNPIVTGEVVPLVRDAARLTGAWVADVNAATAYVPLDFPDNVHPNDAGHLVLANTVYNRMTGPQTIFSGDTFEIVGKYSGKPMEVAGSSTADGASVDQSTDVAASNQKWVLTALTGNIFKIVNVNSGKVADVAGGSTASGANIVQTTYIGALSQQWGLTNLGRGYYKLENQNGHCVLNVTGASLADGALLQQATSVANAEQQSFQLIRQ